MKELNNLFDSNGYLDTDKMIEYVYDNNFIEYDDDVKAKLRIIIRRNKLKRINELNYGT